MNRVTVAMINAGAAVIHRHTPSIIVDGDGRLCLSYGPPHPAKIYEAMEKARTNATAEDVRGTLEAGDTDRLEWLTDSGRVIQRLGRNWRVAPHDSKGVEALANAPWFPSMREAIDEARREV